MAVLDENQAPAMKRLLNRIDRISELTGHAISWIVLLLTLILGYEVLMRYCFNSPTKWAYDISYMLGGTFFLLGAAYTLRMKAHVRIDLFYNQFSPRQRALIDVLFYLVFFFPLWIGLLYHLIPHVHMSWKLAERSLESYWRPPIYPFKTIMPIGVFLLLLQGLAEFVRSLTVLVKGEVQ
jgi:TRAP-type mannitol/chloroaromatic compound transport system permease small subunit